MPWRERWLFAQRQTLDAGRGLSGFLSRLSMFGLVLAVAVLLAVLSVMNGFEREMRERLLGLMPHVSLVGHADLTDWHAREAMLRQQPGVLATGLYYERDVLSVRGSAVHAGRLLGVTPETFVRWQAVLDSEPHGDAGKPVYMGKSLAQRLGLEAGDAFRLVVPAARGPDANPRSVPVSMRLSGLLRSGTELDEKLILADFERVAGLTGEPLTASGLALQLEDVFAAPRLRQVIARQLPPGLYAIDWTGTHGNLYAAIQLSRDLVTLLLVSIIAVAAFNVVSSLILVVTDRRDAIAIWGAMGAARADIQWIFMIQGLLIGVMGASLGVLLGFVLALSAPSLATVIEALLGMRLMNTDVYPLAFLPVDVRLGDAIVLWLVSVTLCVVAAIIPARRAATLPVAAVLAARSA